MFIGAEMRGEYKSTFVQLRDRSGSQDPNAESCAGPNLEVNVIYTTVPGTVAALKTADELGVDLGARVFFLVPQSVPLSFPLTSPPVSVSFTEERFRSMATVCQEAAQVRVRVLLCRDKLQGLLKFLKPQSVVVVGGRKRWWLTPEEKLARVLKSNGHRVIFVDGK